MIVSKWLIQIGGQCDASSCHGQSSGITDESVSCAQTFDVENTLRVRVEARSATASTVAAREHGPKRLKDSAMEKKAARKLEMLPE